MHHLGYGAGCHSVKANEMPDAVDYNQQKVELLITNDQKGKMSSTPKKRNVGREGASPVRDQECAAFEVEQWKKW